MKRILVIFLFVCALPAAAQDDDGSSFVDQTIRQLLEGLVLEMEPALEDMRDFIEQMGPALADIIADVKDWSDYEAPEILENGDIIIRRKPDQDIGPKPIPDREPLPQIEL